VLLVRDDPFEVLMVKRSATGAFPSALVFPGGVVDDDDWAEHWCGVCDGHEQLAPQDIAIRIAGLRECWEEAAVLAAQGEFNLDLHAPKHLPLHHLMSQIGARFDLNSMVHFAHWITPKASPKRWNTYFLIARAPADQRLLSDGCETVCAEWVAPQEAIAMADRGERDLLFSTRANLHLLAQSSSADTAIAAARQRPRFEVHPQAEQKPDGIRVFISEKAGYPVNQGWVKTNLGMRPV
jgi:8-oxo-dGTP pyrophosphatase MutT (NUDIX family)